YARTSGRHADTRSVPATLSQPLAGAAFRASGDLRLVRRNGVGDGVQERRLRAIGKIVLPCRSASTRQPQSLTLSGLESECLQRALASHWVVDLLICLLRQLRYKHL